ncbi:hypothetical protein OLMES_1826 [Oleiphilus messinensis]|uniref:DUF1329 domain-containing protein n=2 Tax=Oleiphilus messinensis TaxID=141451 RepID=A0A1Y0I6P2_9GAMM|nr:hypothetical protein OLMES_1826 [Oleiphilus messinensis]
MLCVLFSVFVSDTELLRAEVSQTPLGAEWQGNADGSIPAWLGDRDKVLNTAASLVSEEPLFIIDGTNFQSHAAKLSDGQKALFTRYPDTYRLPIYASHRTHIAPNWLYEATAKNKDSARLVDGSVSITGVWPGVPFPNPEHGVEVVWNHLLHWRGISAKLNFFEAVVLGKGQASMVYSEIRYAMPYYLPGRPIMDDEGDLLYYMTFTKEPARLAGGGLLVHDSMNADKNPRKAWVYLAEQKRVKRLPSFQFDEPLFNSDNIRTVDEVDLYNGSPKLYDWKIVGKREIYVPYNSRKLETVIYNDPESVFGEHHLEVAGQRYELHRVWIVEGVLKAGNRHIYPKRTLYMDEDSWIVLLADMYDSRGELWRTSVSHTRFRPELTGVWKVADIYYDLLRDRYFVQSAVGRYGVGITYFDDLPAKRSFTPASLRRQALR